MLKHPNMSNGTRVSMYGSIYQLLAWSRVVEGRISILIEEEHSYWGKKVGNIMVFGVAIWYIGFVTL
jgi:hypothetical protein